jgi:DNA-directed RNA polymerase specialized sigma24 family protein
MAKSDNYRYEYTHYCVTDEFITILLNDKPEPDSQPLLELRDRLYEIVLDTAKTQLTANQRELLDLYFVRGYNTNEIADLQGKDQSTIWIALFGRDNRNGAVRKLRNYLYTLPEVRQILQEIAEL